MTDTTFTIDKNEINSILPSRFVFLCSASFEKRSTTIPLSLDPSRISHSVVFRSRGYKNDTSLNEIKNKIATSKVIDFDLNNPVSVARSLTEVVKECSSLESAIVIDITTFTHEILAMLLKLIHDNETKFSSIFCLYNGAADYSNSKENGLTQMWLSKGCRDVRNVIGYPGRMRPTAKTSLIILTGFELERATKLIEIIEPDRLMLGFGNDPTHDNHLEPVAFFQEKFENWKKNYKNSNCTEFGFSCKNIEKTTEVLSDLTADPDENYIVVPLNTKLSTIASSIVALKNPMIQICYSIPEMYNMDDYSSPGEKITVVNLCEILNLKKDLKGGSI